MEKIMTPNLAKNRYKDRQNYYLPAALILGTGSSREQAATALKISRHPFWVVAVLQ
jgi:3-isopropylmalate dehydratase small subunit